jgi:uncharacterized membrane protein YraQ (UPF0718 family)
VNPITALSTWKAFVGQGPLAMMSGRLMLGFIVAVGVGWVVSRLRMKWVLKDTLIEDLKRDEVNRGQSLEGEEGCCHGVKSDQKLLRVFRASMKDFIDVGVYFSIGVSITALFNTGIAPGAKWLDLLAAKEWMAPSVLMLLAFVLSLCSTSDAFVAATLDKFSWAAKLAFLTFGPMMDVKLLFLYQSVLKKKFIIVLAMVLFVVIGIMSIWMQQWMGIRP